MTLSEQDQELEVPSSDSSTEVSTNEDATSKVGDAGAESDRARRNKDDVTDRFKRQRDRYRARVEELEAQAAQTQSQQQASIAPQAQKQAGFDWRDPDGSINRAVARAVAVSSQYMQTNLQKQIQMEESRKYMESQKGYVKEELQEVFDDNPELKELLVIKPEAAVKAAVKIWRIQRGEYDSFSKKVAAGGVSPTAKPGRLTGSDELFGRIKKQAGKASKEDLDSAWARLEEAEKKGVKFQ